MSDTMMSVITTAATHPILATKPLTLEWTTSTLQKANNSGTSVLLGMASMHTRVRDTCVQIILVILVSLIICSF